MKERGLEEENFWLSKAKESSRESGGGSYLR